MPVCSRLNPQCPEPCLRPDRHFAHICGTGVLSLSSWASLMACVLNCFSRVRLFATPWTVACQASLFMGFSRQEYWSVLPYTLGKMPGDLPNPGIQLRSLTSLSLAGRFSPTVKNLPAMQKTQVQSLGQEDLREKGMATHCLMRRVDSLEKTLMLGGIGGRRRR